MVWMLLRNYITYSDFTWFPWTTRRWYLMLSLFGMFILLGSRLNSTFSIGTFLLNFFNICGGMSCVCIGDISSLWCHNYCIRIICSITMINCTFSMALGLVYVYWAILTWFLIQIDLWPSALSASFAITTDASWYLSLIFTIGLIQ